MNLAARSRSRGPYSPKCLEGVFSEVLEHRGGPGGHLVSPRPGKGRLGLGSHPYSSSSGLRNPTPHQQQRSNTGSHKRQAGH
jgi:hypothetical protein